jgi:hypothetical protein
MPEKSSHRKRPTMHESVAAIIDDKLVDGWDGKKWGKFQLAI